MESNSFRFKTVRLVSLTTIVVFMMVFTGVAISGTFKNSGVDNISSEPGSEFFDNENKVGILSNSNVNEVVITISSNDVSNESLSDASESDSISQDSDSSKVQKSSLNIASSSLIEVSHTSKSSSISASSYCDCSKGSTSKCSICAGFIWKDIDRMKIEVDTLTLNRFYDQIQSNTYSVPSYSFDFDSFYDIIEIIKKYPWVGLIGGTTNESNGEYINPYELKACQITVIGNNRCYTYLSFGRDYKGRCFAYSSYDKKIAYISEKDLNYIENIFASVD